MSVIDYSCSITGYAGRQRMLKAKPRGRETEECGETTHSKSDFYACCHLRSPLEFKFSWPCRVGCECERERREEGSGNETQRDSQSALMFVSPCAFERIQPQNE